MLRDSFKKIKQFIRPIPDYPLRKGKNGTFVFIHINKTGGLSIAKAIGLPEKRHLKRHLTVTDVTDIIGKKQFEKAIAFTVVRNPWSKVVSHYKYRVKTNQCNMKDNFIDFDKWVLKTYGPEKDSFYYDTPLMFSQQVDWLKDENGKVVVDHIIKFENLQEDYKKIAIELGTNPELPHINATKKDDYRGYYDEQTKGLIAKCFKDDIDRFGYSFEN